MQLLRIEGTPNEQWIHKNDAVFMSYQISCKYKLSSGQKCSRHSATSNYQQEMDFYL